MEIGTKVKVKVANKKQINYPLKGIVVKKQTSPEGIEMSKVKFSYVECWYADDDLKAMN